jgi:serine acetyltransferase
MASIAVLGAGPHGRQIAYDLNTKLLFDDKLPGLPSCTLGSHQYPWVIGAFWPQVRRQIAESLVWECEPFERGVYVSPAAHLGIEVFLGDHVHVNAGAIVSHGCRLEEFVSVATGAVLCGEVHVESGAVIGAGAIVKHGGIRIGENAIVGMGAVVIDDVPPGTTVVGVPGRCL